MHFTRPTHGKMPPKPAALSHCTGFMGGIKWGKSLLYFHMRRDKSNGNQAFTQHTQPYIDLTFL